MAIAIDALDLSNPTIQDTNAPTPPQAINVLPGPAATEESAEDTAVSHEELAQLFKLLSSKPRLQILSNLVREGELNVTDLCQRLSQTQPAVSHHLALMRLHGILQLRRDGKHSYYSVNTNRVDGVIELFQQLVLGQQA